MEMLEAIDATSALIIIAATIIILLVLFRKAIKLPLKLAVLFVMLLFIAYFLAWAGIIEFPRLK